MFASQGYAATSVEQLAIACRVGKDTIYRRFASKRALFEAAIERLRVRVLQRLERVASEEGTGLERLRRAARWFLTVNVEPELVALRRIAFSEALLIDKAQPTNTPDPIFERLVSIVRDAQLEGAIVEGEARFIAGQLIHAVATGPSNDTMLGSVTYQDARAQDAFFEKAWALFLKGAVRPPR
jgi:AcrR family transcriptional regulator